MSVFLISLLACAALQGLSFDPATETAAAEALLSSGNLAGAAAVYDAAMQKAPENVDVVSGAAYVKLLQGNLFGMPSIERPWLADLGLDAIGAEPQRPSFKVITGTGTHE